MDGPISESGEHVAINPPKMARSSKLRRKPQMVQHSLSIRAITTITAAFVLLCFLLPSIMLPKMSLSTTNPAAVFQQPSEVPDHVISSLDAIVILGGGRPSAIDKPPVFVERRCDDAYVIVERVRDIGRRAKGPTTDIPILCISAGTAHLPQLLGPDGLPIWESTASAAYLFRKYNLSKNVYVETTSYDTIGNAFYTRSSFTNINGWRKLLIITNEFHMARTKVIFDWIFGLENDNKASYELSYLSSPNVGLSEEAVIARKARESKSLLTVRDRLAPQYQSMKAVWSFLNNDHALYTAEKLIERGMKEPDQGDAQLKESYGGFST